MLQNFPKFTIINDFPNLNNFTLIIVDSSFFILILISFLRNKLINTKKIIKIKIKMGASLFLGP